MGRGEAGLDVSKGALAADWSSSRCLRILYGHGFGVLSGMSSRRSVCPSCLFTSLRQVGLSWTPSGCLGLSMPVAEKRISVKAETPALISFVCDAFRWITKAGRHARNPRAERFSPIPWVSSRSKIDPLSGAAPLRVRTLLLPSVCRVHRQR